MIRRITTSVMTRKARKRLLGFICAQFFNDSKNCAQCCLKKLKNYAQLIDLILQD